MGRVDPTVNLAADAGEHFSSAGGYGSLHDAGSDPAAALRRTALDSIARDINRHAAVVLEGAPEGLADMEGGGGGSEETSRIAKGIAQQQQQKAAAAAGKAAAATAGGGDGEGSVSPERLEEWQQRAASALEDLSLDDREKHYTPLNIQDPRAYFGAAPSAANGGKPGSQQAAAAAGAAGAAAGGRTMDALAAALAAIQPVALPDPPCDPGAAFAVLLELSQDRDEAVVAEFGPVAAAALQFPPQDKSRGLQPLLLVRPPCCPGRSGRCLHARVLMHAAALDTQLLLAHMLCPHPHQPTQEHLRGEALKTNELLRHMWGTFPLLSALRADKAGRLAGHLQDQRALLASHMQAHPGEWVVGWVQ